MGVHMLFNNFVVLKFACLQHIGCLGVHMFNTLVVIESTCCTTHLLYRGPHVLQHIDSLGVHMLFNTLVLF